MFITFEGPEGSGKTTQQKLLAAFLRERGFSVYLTREPGGTAIGDQIRKVLLDLGYQEMGQRTEILLFLASRAQHTEQVIRPQLEQGAIVLCDRYQDSTVAYQGYGYGIDVGVLKALNAFATDGLVPDWTILLDIEVEVGLQRRQKGGGWNRLDAYKLDFHRRVRQGFLKLAGEEPDRWMVVDADQDVDRVQKEIQQALQPRIQMNKDSARP